MTLQEKLDAFKIDFETNQAPPAAVEAFHRSNQELIDKGYAEHALKAGDMAPEFVLADSDGNKVSSRELLAKGPVVLSLLSRCLVSILQSRIGKLWKRSLRTSGHAGPRFWLSHNKAQKAAVFLNGKTI